MAEPKKKPRPNADDVTSALAATATGVGSASMVANAQMARTVRKETTAKGRVERAAKSGQAAADAAAQPVTDARAVAGAAKARQDRKATTAEGRDQRMARSTTQPVPMKAVPVPKAGGAPAAAAVADKPARAHGPNGRFAKAAAQKTKAAAAKTKTAIADTAQGIKGSGSIGQKAMRSMAVANPYLLATSGIVGASGAWNAARDNGASRQQAAIAAAAAAAPSVAAAAAPTLLGRFAPTVASTLSKAAIPLTIAAAGVGAVRAGLQAHAEGASAGAITGRAALGAADALTFGLASKAYDSVTGSKAGARSKPHDEDRAKPEPTQGPALIAQAVGSGQAAKMQGVDAKPTPGVKAQPAAKPTPKPGRGSAGDGSKRQDLAQPKEKASRNGYQTVDGRQVQGTKGQIENWERQKTKGQTSGPDRKPKAA